MCRDSSVLVFLLLLIAHATPVAHAEIGPRTVTVQGHAVVRVDPDEVVLELGVETFATDVSKAKSQNDSIITRVKAAATAHGVRGEHMKSEFMEIEPEQHRKDGTREFLHYRVRRTISIRLQDLTRFESLLTDVLNAGANHIHEVTFRTNEFRRHRDRARDLAITAAREKARAMASRLEAKVGRVWTIEEGGARSFSPYGWWGRSGNRSMYQNVIQEGGAAHTDDGGVTMPGQLDVEARVVVTFELE